MRFAKILAWRRANKDKVALYNKKWVEENRDKVNTAYNRWYHANPDKAREKRNAYARNNPDKIAERNARNYKEKRAERIAYSRRWRAENQDIHRATKKRWADKNPDKVKAMAAASRKRRMESDPVGFAEKERARRQAWMAVNRDLDRMKVQRRRARRKNLVHAGTDTRIEKAICMECARISREMGTAHHVDHIIPIVAGGWHHHLNLQILPCGINIRKGGNPFWEMPGYKSWRDVPRYLWPEKLTPAYTELQERVAA